MAFGQTFQPGVAGTDQASDPRKRRLPPSQQAIQMLSLRLPKHLGPSAIAPAPLLTGPGGGGQPTGALAENLQRAFLPQTQPARPTTVAAPSPPVPTGPRMAPSVSPATTMTTPSAPAAMPSPMPSPLASPAVQASVSALAAGRMPSRVPGITGAPSPISPLREMSAFRPPPAAQAPTPLPAPRFAFADSPAGLPPRPSGGLTPPTSTPSVPPESSLPPPQGAVPTAQPRPTIPDETGMAQGGPSGYQRVPENMTGSVEQAKTYLRRQIEPIWGRPITDAEFADMGRRAGYTGGGSVTGQIVNRFLDMAARR